MLLDDKCRKQVDTFKQGGTITERRQRWAEVLREVLPNMRAQMMLEHIEGTAGPVDQQQVPQRGSVKRKRVHEEHTQQHSQLPVQVDAAPSALECEQCTICHEHLHAVDRVHQCRLPCRCRSSFHSACILPWLKKKGSCPVCRENVKLEFPNGPNAPEFRVVPGAPLTEESGGGQPCQVDDEQEEAEAPSGASTSEHAAPRHTAVAEGTQLDNPSSSLLDLSFMSEDHHKADEVSLSSALLDDDSGRSLSFTEEVIFDSVTLQEILDNSDLCGPPIDCGHR